MTKPTDTLGGLHELLIRGLPDFVEDGVLNVKSKLAPRIGISYQAVYKWFDRDRISPKRVETLVYLSENSKKKPATMVVDGKKEPWAPLKKEDFWKFM